MLSYYVRQGKIEPLQRGVYRYIDAPEISQMQWESLLIATTIHQEAVVCLLSALSYYELTDQLTDLIWLAIPNESGKRSAQNIRFMRLRNMRTGIEKRSIDGITFSIFDPERTIIDTFRLMDTEIAFQALQAYFQHTEHRPDLQKFAAYSQQLRFNIEPYLLPFTI